MFYRATFFGQSSLSVVFVGEKQHEAQFYPLAGCRCMALHYSTSVLFCPIPVAYEKACGTGKTTALVIGLSPTGAYPSRFVSQATYAKYSDMCSSSYLPLAIDDPKSKNVISNLVMSL